MIGKSLVIIKPDGVERGLAGEIIKRFENVGLKIISMKMVWIDEKFSKKHYAAHIEKPFYRPTEKYITSGPVIAMVLEGIKAVSLVRKMTGVTEPHKAAPGTIRGDFSHMSYEFADGKGISVKNIIHASDEDGAKKEIDLWFKKDELHSYTTVFEHHTQG